MATKDISRMAFDPRKHYSSVRMQQGRVIVDDDWNENERIDNEDRRVGRVEIIGPTGSPDKGFSIDNVQVTTDGLIDFDILPGSLYLGGLRLEMETVQQEPTPIYETYRTQKDWLQQPPNLHPIPSDERIDLVYLSAWQRPVGAVEDSELFEVALGGPDTSMRVRNMRRVLIEPNVQTMDCAKAWQNLTKKWEDEGKGELRKGNERVSSVRLTVSFSENGVQDDLCKPSVAGGYLGAENQAIRIQLVDANHFTWGFDNASPLYRVEVNGNEVTMLTDPKDQAHWPLAGQIVEILPRSAVLPNGERIAEEQGHLSRVASSYNPDEEKFTIPIADSLPANFGREWTSTEPPEYLFMRVWDRGADKTTDPEISFTPGTAVPLGKTGLEITITGVDRVPETYWIIAARPETPNKVVPWQLEVGLPPHGVRRFYAPLALIRWSVNATGDVVGEVIRDCRRTFRPLTELHVCCTYFVGDGVHTHGDFNSIEEAIKHLPPQGGRICVLPGEHTANATLTNLQNIHIIGCGVHTIVHPHPNANNVAAPIFKIESCQNIQIENMTLMAVAGTAIQVDDPDWRYGDTETRRHGDAEIVAASQMASREITINNNRIVARIHAIEVNVKNELQGDNDIWIAHNQIGMLDESDGKAGIFSNADDVLIEWNRVVVVPAPDPDNPNDPREPNDPSDSIFDICVDPILYYTGEFPVYGFLHTTFLYVGTASGLGGMVYNAEGGIQLACGSERAKIINNEIIGGRSNGITLGHLPPQIQADPQASPTDRPHLFAAASGFIALSGEVLEILAESHLDALYEIAIEGNTIRNMGLAGIGAVAFFDTEIGLMVSVEGLTINRNSIKNCVQHTPENIPDRIADELGFGGIALSDCEDVIIKDNQIEDNGISHIYPVCGIYIWHGEKVDISENRILNNGPRDPNADRTPETGKRAGILISMCVAFKAADMSDSEGLLRELGVPALRVHDNIVTQPLGQALAVVAMGAVSVVNNQFSSQDVDFQANPLSLLAGAVFIFNLGISQDVIGLLASTMSFLRTNKASAGDINYDGGTQSISFAPTLGILQRLFQAFLSGGNVMFNDNQTTLELRRQEFDFAFSSQFIFSLDDVSFSSNQSDCNFLMDILFTNTFIFGVSVRTNDNRFEEGLIFSFLSLFSMAMANTNTYNQASHCLLALGYPHRRQAGNIVFFNQYCKNFVALLTREYG